MFIGKKKPDTMPAVALTWLRRNWFLLGILTALLLGFLLTGLGSVLNRGGIARTLLIVLLFLISGFTLPTEAITSGLKDYRLHIYIQIFIFLVIPGFFLLTTLPFRSLWDHQLYAGIFAVAVLPTTISSCIVFTQISGGNLMGTMFNAAAANILGVILSPLLLSLLMRGGGDPLPAAEVLKILRNLSLQMLVPIACGQILRQFFKQVATKQKKRLSVVSNIFILFILFFAFSKTARNPEFVGNLTAMIGPFAYLAAAHLLLLFIAYAGARLLHFGRENTISVLYTAPQKTLAVGVPLISTYFASTPEVLGITLLPLVFYHAWQLLVAGFVKSSRLVPDVELPEAQSSN
jgi:sodium/bile acid cotransporter 7